MSQAPNIHLNSIFEAGNLFRQRQIQKGHEVMQIGRLMSKAKHDRQEGVVCIIFQKQIKNALGIGEAAYYLISLRSEFWGGWSFILNDENKIPTYDKGTVGETILDRTVDSMRQHMKQYGEGNVVYDVILRDGTEHFIKAKDLIDGYFIKYNSWATHLKYQHNRDCWGYPQRILSYEDPL